MDNHKPQRLSAAAFNELRDIVREEIDEPMTDEEIEAMGIRLLKFFKLLADDTPVPKPKEIEVSEEESKALAYIRHCLFHDRREPTARGVAEAIGKRSSRSGHRMLLNLLSRGLVWRGKDHRLVMRK